MSKKARVFVPLTKVDEEQRLVYGRITQEILDKSGEVMDYEVSKPNFEKWSNDLHEASGGLSKGNVRVMHGLHVAGKLTELDFNDDEKAIDVCAKIVDDAEWEKVTTGCYTGFSVGGSYGKKWTETDPNDPLKKVKRFEAKPNEVSLVDNPCVPTASFSMFKADGTETSVEFQVENDDEAWPDFAKADVVEEKPAEEVKEAPAAPVNKTITNDVLVSQATEMAKASGDPTKTWMDFIHEARDILTKALAEEKVDAPKEEATEDKVATDSAADASAAETASDKSTKVTPAGVKQVWTASDGKTFEKKDEAVAHENELAKTAKPKTAAEELRERLQKATETVVEPEAVPLMDDWDRLGKVIQVLQTPFDPEKLSKGMYTVSRFASCLWELGSLVKTVQREGPAENDSSDNAVAASMRKSVADLAGAFKSYVDDQITELLAGIDDAIVVEVYDYYMAAAKTDPADQLAKDVCSVIEERRDASEEVRDRLSKVWGTTAEVTDEVNPTLQKRFDDLAADNADLKKVAEEAIGKVEELTKRVTEIEETPLPRAPRNVALLPGDTEFLGKTVKTDEEKMAVLEDMLKTHGADGMATLMIKAAQASGGQKLNLRT